MELMTVVNREVHGYVEPYKMLDLFHIGSGNDEKRGIKIRELVNDFYCFLGFARLTNANVVMKAVREGVEEAIFGYYHGPEPKLGPDLVPENESML